MIALIAGKVEAISEKYVIINVNGVGYRVTIGEKIKQSIAKIGDEVKLFTRYSLNLRDGSVELYGFDTVEELNFFELLTSVSGIGPRSAQSILSAVDLQTLQIAIIQGDDSYLRRVAGIGEKTAKRLILELKNKVMVADVGGTKGADLSNEQDAIDALVALGYSAYQARDAVKHISTKAKTAEDKIKEALKNLGAKK